MPMRRHLSLLRVVGSRPGFVSFAAALAMLASLTFTTSVEAASARIAADGDCLNMRQAPSLAGAVINCINDRAIVTIVPGTVSADGVEWQQVRTSTAVGWVAARYLVTVPDGTIEAPAPAPTLPVLPSAAPSTPVAFEAPPAGGMTFGLAGTTSPAAVVAAQAFPVAGLSVIDPGSQRYLTYIPGAPDFVNSLNDTTLRADSVVMVRRAGTAPLSDTSPVAPAASMPLTGTPRTFASPARGGLVLGVAGTNDVGALIKVQPFAVDVVMALDVPTQRWLTYIPGAPEWVSTLNSVTLRPAAVVFLRRSQAASDPTPAVTAAATTMRVPITYYYCTRNSTVGAGDGGGFCGAMRNGSVVHAGAASCDRAHFGQQFRVVGDPNNLVYTCMDTGGGVTSEHRDIWFATSAEAYTWWRAVAPGGYGAIEVLTAGTGR